MNSVSLYRRICDHLTPDGQLPRDFVLADKDTQSGKARLLPGAKDGMSLIHKEQQLDRISSKIVQCIKSDSYVNITGLLRLYRTLKIIDPVIRYIQNNQEDFDAHKIIEYACHLVFESKDIELVKFGIGLLGMFDFGEDPNILSAVILLALYDEFTLFSIVALRSVKDGNSFQFSIAQRVHGWGKIHAVELMEADSEEIQDWLLRFGCKNDVKDAYLALTCAVKGNLIGTLRSKMLDEELFEGICIIMDALLSNEQVAGINEYEHAEEALRLYLQAAVKSAVTLKHLWHVMNVRDWLFHTQSTYKDELLILCTCIADRPRWRDMIKKAVTEGEAEQLFYAIDTAKRLQMDITSLLFKTVIKKPLEYSAFLSPLFARADYAKRLTAAYEKALPLKEMAAGMGDHLFACSLKKEHQCLIQVLAELGPYPNMGENIVLTALQSPVIHIRNCALEVLETWSADLWVSVWHISPAIGGALKRTALDEVDSDTRKRMVMLLNK